eukprot:6211928-Pleurochrysis_carterae.AAC.3
MVIFGSRGQNAKQSASIAIWLGYRDKTNCVRGRTLMYGWTVLCKWGHPVVVTLPVTNGTIRHTRRMMKFCESLLRRAQKRQ